MTFFDRELEKQLKEVGNRLLNPPSSIDDLLTLLDEVESLLAYVEQAPSISMWGVLLPQSKKLINNKLLRHYEVDVKVLVVSCIIQIIGITAPYTPYKDEQMKEIFQLIVATFENMSHVSTHSYKKVASILDIIAKVKLSLVMLDLECDALVVKMFQSFLKIIRSNHPLVVLSTMETIMTLVIDESEDISLDLLHSLFASVRKESQNISPTSWKFGEQIIIRINAQLEKIITPTQKLLNKLEGALDVKVDSNESATFKPFVIHEDLQVDKVQKVNTMVQDKIVPIQHIDFVFPEEFYGVVELKVILLSVLPRVISDLKEVLNTKVLILLHYKTRGWVFLNQGSIMQKYNQKLFQYFILDFQWIISYYHTVLCLVWIGIWVWLGLVVYHYHLFKIIGLVFEIV